MASIFDGINVEAQADPLLHAESLQKACAKVGFDWSSPAPVFAKVREELAEIQEAMANPDKNQLDVQEEMGDLLFACINLSRHLNIQASQALAQANTKFATRFKAIENIVEQKQQALTAQDIDALEALWLEVKRRESKDKFSEKAKK